MNAVTEILVTFLVFTAMILFLNYHWKRRRLYRIASKIQGPPGYPLFGSSLSLIGSTEHTFEWMVQIMNDYPNFLKIWFGSKLILVVSKAEYLETIFNSPQCLEKDDFYHVVRPVIGTGLFAADLPKWKKNRKLINPAFNQKILDSFVEIFAENAGIFVRKLMKKTPGETFDVFYLSTALSLDNLYESSMGIKVNEQENPSGLGEWADTIMHACFLRMVNYHYRFDFLFNFTKLSKKFKNAVTNLNNFTEKIIKERRAIFDEKMRKYKEGEMINDDESKRKTFLELLFQLSYQGEKITDEELRQEVDTFTVAGTDTTASTLSFCFIMLGMHPEIQQKVYQEILDVVGEDRDVSVEDLPRLNLLERFIKETLRFFPNGFIILRSITSDVKLDENYFLPKGSSACLALYKVHHDERYWNNPKKFDPDRFLPEENAKRHPYAYVPFSAGPRNCIGGRYAMMAMKTTLATVVRKLIIKTEYKSIEEMKLALQIVLRPSNGYKISVEPRN